MRRREDKKLDSVPWVSFWRESEISTAAAAATAELGVDSFTTQQQQRVGAKRVTGVRVFIHTQLLSCLFPRVLRRPCARVTLVRQKMFISGGGEQLKLEEEDSLLL